jgi:hypothetical protein
MPSRAYPQIHPRRDTMQADRRHDKLFAKQRSRAKKARRAVERELVEGEAGHWGMPW